nr:RNA-directed DNA polymerase, eukaryota, reverse transcriptase zinc-binding domain protein [Tanacetum cinerariifolium]
MLGELNATLVSLTLRFKPLTRIKPFLGNLVSCNQSAFIPGRHIQDNILLTQEIMRGYNRKRGPKRVAFKIDIQKAYNTINWEFLKALEGFGFHEKMVNLIMQCVIIVAYTLNVNGDRIGYFKGGRGLRSMNEEESNAISFILPFVTGKLPVKYLGLPLIAKRWKWPNDWYDKFSRITSLNIPAIDAGIADKIVWKTNNGMITEFSVSIVHQDLSRQSLITPWWKLSVLQGMIGAGNGNNINSILKRLLLVACVYHIWQERNNRIFKDSMKSSEEVFKGIVEVIKYKPLGITMKDSKVVRYVEDKWKISCKKNKQKS